MAGPTLDVVAMLVREGVSACRDRTSDLVDLGNRSRRARRGVARVAPGYP